MSTLGAKAKPNQRSEEKFSSWGLNLLHTTLLLAVNLVTAWRIVHLLGDEQAK